MIENYCLFVPRVDIYDSSLTIDPDLGQLLAQFTEAPGWKNLPSEPTSVTRVEENLWEVRVGEYKERFNQEQLEGRVIETLLPPAEPNSTAD